MFTLRNSSDSGVWTNSHLLKLMQSRHSGMRFRTDWSWKGQRVIAIFTRGVKKLGHFRLTILASGTPSPCASSSCLRISAGAVWTLRLPSPNLFAQLLHKPAGIQAQDFADANQLHHIHAPDAA